jgi:hypothetical protein
MSAQDQNRSLTPTFFNNIYGNEIKDNDISGDLNIGSTVVKLPSYNILVGAES